MSAMLSEPPRSAPTEISADESDRQLRTQFLRRVAHDIASPTGVTMTVLDELASTPSPRPELLAMARRSLKRLMRLSEQLPLCAELEGGELEPDPSATDVRQVLQQAFDDAIAIDGRKDVSTSCSMPDKTIVIPGEGRLLTTVLREIVGNALKIASSKVQVSLVVEDGIGVIRIDDDGPGFNEDSLATFGRRFVKRSSTRGLGLSLSMAKEVLAMHHGDIRVETSPLIGRRGQPGASVVVTLPI